MEPTKSFTPASLVRDLISGLIVFLVALPLCLGIALASNAPLFSGLVAGIVGGIVVGILSGSHVSVSGPAAGLTAIVAAQIANLSSFEAFLLAVVVGGVIQIALGVAKAGSLSAFFPSSVIKGLLAAIGVILILKQIPHLFGLDKDPVGDMAFEQTDHENPFSEIWNLFEGQIHVGAMVIGLVSLAILLAWDRIKPLKKSLVPVPLVVVLLGVVLERVFAGMGGVWLVEESHRVKMTGAESAAKFIESLQHPDFTQILNPAIYVAGITIAVVASLETLLNLEAVDRLDPKQRHSPPSRELIAQGVGNMCSGLLGGLPVTSVVIRGSVNVHAGAQSKLSAIWHGVLLMVSVLFLASWLNLIPLSCLAAILLVTGFKLASPKLFQEMWKAGRYQFLPFIITLVAIVFTDLLIGIVFGLCVSIVFILWSNLKRPVNRVVERHVAGDVLRIELGNQVSFLNRAAIERHLREVPAGSHVLLDARHTDYVDPDVLALLRDFRDKVAPAHGVTVSCRGFRQSYNMHDEIRYVDYTTRELQNRLTPAKVLQLLCEGNQRFRSGQTLERDFPKQLREEVVNQHPMAVVVSGIHSRVPAELIFDLGLGDIMGIRVGGNVIGSKVVGCAEYGCVVTGAKLIVVMGHTGSAMVTAAVNQCCRSDDFNLLDRCPNLSRIVDPICGTFDPEECSSFCDLSPAEKAVFVDNIARRNVQHCVERLYTSSPVLQQLIEQRRVAVIGAMYDVASGEIEFFVDEALGLHSQEARSALNTALPTA